MSLRFDRKKRLRSSFSCSRNATLLQQLDLAKSQQASGSQVGKDSLSQQIGGNFSGLQSASEYNSLLSDMNGKRRNSYACPMATTGGNGKEGFFISTLLRRKQSSSNNPGLFRNSTNSSKSLMIHHHNDHGVPENHALQNNRMFTRGAGSDLGIPSSLASYGFSHLTSLDNTKMGDPYRFSQATLEDTHEDELNVLLGELSALQRSLDEEFNAKSNGLGNNSNNISCPSSNNRNDSNSIMTNRHSNHIQVSSTSNKEFVNGKPAPSSTDSGVRTDSPDNDSGFSDSASLLSSGSSLSASGSSSGSSASSTSACPSNNRFRNSSLPTNAQNVNSQQSSASSSNALHSSHGLLTGNNVLNTNDREKAEKIRIALDKMQAASVTRLYVKAFCEDGSSKALMVEEGMTAARVLSLLADKNHVALSAKWAIVEHIPHLYMERIYEDHEDIVKNLLMWTRDSKNKIYFVKRDDKYDVFMNPQRYLMGSKLPQAVSSDCMDEHTKNGLIEEFFSHGVGVPEIESYLYLKAEGKKSWKKFAFVLRSFGIYYYPKGKSNSPKDLVCLATIDHNQQIYQGFGWKKKLRSPTEYGFVVKPASLQVKSNKHMKYMCAEDEETLKIWMAGLRLAKNGKAVWENYKCLMEDVAHDDLDRFGRSVSFASMTHGVHGVPSRNGDRGLEEKMPITHEEMESFSNASYNGNYHMAPDTISTSSSGSSSASSSNATLIVTSNREEGFESEFPMGGTIKRKPSNSLAPKLPLTLNTRSIINNGDYNGSVEHNSPSGIGTLKFKKRTPDTVISPNASCPKPPAPVRLVMPPAPVQEEDIPFNPDDLPPPPPELLFDPGLNEMETTQPPPPPPPPPSNLPPPPPLKPHFVAAAPQSAPFSPKKLDAPADEFMRDLQKVMQKKWQVAQKCNMDSNMTPHDILGFRSEGDNPKDGAAVQSPDGMNNVRAWVSQHYGATVDSIPPCILQQSQSTASTACPVPPSPSVISAHSGNVPNNGAQLSPKQKPIPPKKPQMPSRTNSCEETVIYENFHSKRNSNSSTYSQNQSEQGIQLRARKPPPPVPKRSDSTHLSAHIVFN